VRDDSAEYYRMRATAERERAKGATTSDAQKIHIALAEAYKQRAKDISAKPS
jgi:hypothetical protein